MASTLLNVLRTFVRNKKWGFCRAASFYSQPLSRSFTVDFESTTSPINQKQECVEGQLNKFSSFFLHSFPYPVKINLKEK